MKTLETDRLILRPFTPEDFAEVHSYASDPSNVTYMVWGPNTEEDTRNFISFAIRQGEAKVCRNYQYAAVCKQANTLIGACDLSLTDVDSNMAEVGWIVHKDYWRLGYASEMGAKLIEFGFGELGLHRIIAHCDVENTASFRTMERIGMRQEGLLFDSRPANKNPIYQRPFSDEFIYAILKSEWEVAQEIAYYNSLAYEFNDFVGVPALTNGQIYLMCTNKVKANPLKKYLDSYRFAICKGSEKIGNIDIRIGYGGGPHNDNLYYGGNIGYNIEEKYRGNNYALEACKLLIPIARAHKMTKILITNDIDNVPSRRVCEKLGAKFIRTARLPEYSDNYKEGKRFSNIYEWSI